MPTPLPTHPSLSKPPGPVVLCILDGIGLGGGLADDAVAQARTPHLDALLSEHPNLALRAHGVAVGLPSDADMGNSEVGHNAMGAGRIFDQGAKLVEHALSTGAAWETDTWRSLTAGQTLHLLGLTSDGNVHSHIRHLEALIARAAHDGVRRLRVHTLTDGRDVEARSALRYIEPLEALLASCRERGLDYCIASGGGRMHITMDRYEADWPMVERGWRCHVHGEGRRFGTASEAIRVLYDENPELDDQWLPAFVCVDESGEPVGRIKSGDAVLFFNFRGDRAIEISSAFEEDSFSAFPQPDRPEVFFAGMMEYDGDRHIPAQYLVAPPAIDRTVGEYLAAAGLRTFAVSETQKYGHVTFFFNGNRSGYLDETLERYVEVPSDVLPFDEAPAMKASEIVDAAVDAIAAGHWDHVRLNIANGDMVGHTGNLSATIEAVEVVDTQLGRLIEATRAAGGILLVTADHGNADEMWMRKKGQVVHDGSGSPLPRTSHTLARVPFVLFAPGGDLTVRSDLSDPGIASVGTTLLELCGLSAPADYEPGLVRLRP